jgi:hypothetical protein
VTTSLDRPLLIEVRPGEHSPTHLALLVIGSTELRYLADAAWLVERRVGELATAALADLWWGPALGHYRQGHRPPPYPADAPALPRPHRIRGGDA